MNLSWEAASFIASTIVIVLQFWQIYTTTRIKLWVTEKFVSNESLRNTLYWRDAARREEQNV